VRWGDLCAAALQPGPGRVDLRAGPLRWARAGPLRWARPCPAAAAFLSSIHRCSVVSPTRARIDASEQARTGDREQARTGTGRPRGRVSSGCAQVTSRADRLSVLKSHFNPDCIGDCKQLLSKSEKRFVHTHWVQEGLGLSE
jgi:hypothetical protein